MKTLVAALLAAIALPVAADDYRSTTADYMPYRETSMADWRGANDEMGQLMGHGGHMGHMGNVNAPSRDDGHGDAMGRQEATPQPARTITPPTGGQP